MTFYSGWSRGGDFVDHKIYRKLEDQSIIKLHTKKREIGKRDK